MRNFLGAIVLFMVANSILAQVGQTAYSNFKKDSSYFILADKVNIRLNPDTAAKTITQLSIGERVRVVEVTEIPFTKNGYTTNWCRVLFNNNGLKQEGYIWGGYIAIQTIHSINDDALMFMYGIHHINTNDDFDEIYLQVRMCKNKTQLAKLELKAVGSLNTGNTAESIGSRKVAGVMDIFKINFSDGACAGAFGAAYFFWDGKSLFHIATLNEGFDAPNFWRNDFIFPADKNGQKGYIINKSESGYYGNDNKEHIDEWEKITYTWDGAKLIKVKTEKKK